MKTNVSDVRELQREFGAIQLPFGTLHDEMQMYLDGYEHNFFYKARTNVTRSVNIGVPLVQVFVDKLWYHTSEFPRINVPSTAEGSEAADMREKIVLAEHQTSPSRADHACGHNQYTTQNHASNQPHSAKPHHIPQTVASNNS